MRTKLKPKRGRPQRYPWNKWLSGKKFTLVIGEDILCSVHTFRVNFAKKAKAIGYRTHTVLNVPKIGVNGTKFTLTIRATPMPVKTK